MEKYDRHIYLRHHYIVVLIVLTPEFKCIPVVGGGVLIFFVDVDGVVLNDVLQG